MTLALLFSGVSTDPHDGISVDALRHYYRALAKRHRDEEEKKAKKSKPKPKILEEKVKIKIEEQVVIPVSEFLEDFNFLKRELQDLVNEINLIALEDVLRDIREKERLRDLRLKEKALLIELAKLQREAEEEELLFLTSFLFDA